ASCLCGYLASRRPASTRLDLPAGFTRPVVNGRKLPKMEGNRVIVADDDVLVRQGVASVLADAGYDVVGQVGDPTALHDGVRELAPDLAVIDIRMPPTHSWEGLEAARSIREEFPQIGILLLSAH